MRESLNDKLENLWKSSGAWPEFIQVMRLALRNSLSSGQTQGRELSSLSKLPGLCCQAAGGEPDWADDLALAWLLDYSAAQLMDSVQDNDEPDAWWVKEGIGVALSAASGLYFSGSLALSATFRHPVTQKIAAVITEDFSNTFLLMGSGQHADLTRTSLTLAQYWRLAEAKSGAFFSLACRLGARLATDEIGIVSEYSRFGKHLGLLIQIADDLDDIRAPQGSGFSGQKPSFSRSLAVVYALEVLPNTKFEELKGYLRIAQHSPADAHEAVSLIDQSGAADYILIEIERHKGEAMAALENANPHSQARDALHELVQSL